MSYIVSCKFRTSVVTSNKYSPAGSWYYREKNQRMFQAASFFNANNPGFEILFFGSFFWRERGVGGAQLTFTCSKPTTETLEKGVKYVQSYQQKHQNVVLEFVLLTLNIFHTFFSCFSIFDFGQVNVSWVVVTRLLSLSRDRNDIRSFQHYL